MNTSPVAITAKNNTILISNNMEEGNSGTCNSSELDSVLSRRRIISDQEVYVTEGVPSTADFKYHSQTVSIVPVNSNIMKNDEGKYFDAVNSFDYNICISLL